MLALALLATLQLGDTTPARLAPSYAATRDSLEAAQLRFFSQWGEAYRAAASDNQLWITVRGVMRSCPWPSVARVDSVVRRQAHMVGESVTAGRCPTWLLDSAALGGDESEGVDNALAARFQVEARLDRARLLARFDSAALRFPDDQWIVGQRVRLLVDQRQLDAARVATDACSNQRWWCWALRGFVHHHRGALRTADDAFRQAVHRMSPPILCRWSDIGPLIPAAARREFEAAPCESRVALARDAWWLSDPVWTDSVNERRAEHFARMTSVTLRRALDRDERWAWAPERGGDALAEMVLRYGWPNVITWGGEENDDAQVGRVLVAGGRPNSPYTTLEYRQPRFHLLPSWKAIREPFTATVNDWSVGARSTGGPPDGEASAPVAPEQALRGDRRATPTAVAGVLANQWWPEEHVELKGGVHGLPMPALVLLPRQHSTIIGVASDLSTEGPRAGATYDRQGAALLWSDRADSVVRVDTTSGIVGSPAALAGEIPVTPALVELTATRGAPGSTGRARFAVTPPRPLSRMAPGEKAISEIVLLDPGELSVESLPTREVLRTMRAQQSVVAGRAVRLYWESYGYRPTDTLAVAVAIRRVDAGSALRRLAATFQLASDPNQPFAISWQRTHANAGVTLNSGGAPVLPQSVVVDLERLTAGEYEIMIAIKQPGGAEIVSTKAIRRVVQ